MLIFTFDNLSSKDKATKEAVKNFKKVGANVAQVDAGGAPRRTSGVLYRELHLTFVDSQVITMRIKETGDIFQVKLNNKLIPITNQDDHKKAIKEMAALMARGRAAFQKRLARRKTALPSSVKTAAPKMEALLEERVTTLRTQVEAAKVELAELVG